MTVTDHAILLRTKELLSGPDKWTLGTNARNSSAEPVSPDDSSATCWCLCGALIRAYIELGGNSPIAHQNAELALDHALPSATQAANYVQFNDMPTTGYEAVSAVLDRAIASTAPTGI
jgi:hypothetical protein